MANLNVRFQHPTNGGSVEAEVDEEMTAADAIEELIRASFISPPATDYQLGLKGSVQLRADQTLRAAGVQEQSVLLVMSRAPGAVEASP